MIPTLDYDETAARFHQWSVQGMASGYGLSFDSAEIASDFAHAVKSALQYVKKRRGELLASIQQGTRLRKVGLPSEKEVPCYEIGAGSTKY